MRVSQLAQALEVNPSTVSRMNRKLAQTGYVTYNRYGTSSLTTKRRQLGKILMQHHGVIEQFLRIIGADEAYLTREAKEIESNISFYTIERIASFNQYFTQDESRLQSFYQSCFN